MDTIAQLQADIRAAKQEKADLERRAAELVARLDEREKTDNWQPVVSYRMKFKDLTDDEQVRVAKEYAREHNMSFFDAVERLANEL